jgi:hypothetical protein
MRAAPEQKLGEGRTYRWLRLARAFASAGRNTDARRTAEHALELARAGDDPPAIDDENERTLVVDARLTAFGNQEPVERHQVVTFFSKVSSGSARPTRPSDPERRYPGGGGSTGLSSG